ncbi:MAG: hypothetical protein ACM3UR_11675 [Bacteroidota bacterium]|jgi:hypothetical protein|nr:hypothetical protein [Ignavibacteria bacterium]MCU7520803.1 hypothetical protein [Ignavibacteria bacterium]
MGKNPEQKSNKLEKIIKSFNEQAKTLQEIIDKVKAVDLDAEFPQKEDEEQKQEK